jgi:hypothetical protein
VSNGHGLPLADRGQHQDPGEHEKGKYEPCRYVNVTWLLAGFATVVSVSR